MKFRKGGRGKREQGKILFQKYIILETLYSGKDSRVYLSNHIGLEQKRIIKRLNRNLVCEENFRSESNVLKNLRHEGIPIIYDIAVERDAYFIIEEYIDGVNLYDYVKDKGTLSQDEAVIIGLQISKIISYLHSRKPIPVLYLDLKPGNILINDGKVYLVDFGNSMFLNATRKYMSGTKGYAAPEQFTFEGIDCSTDVYGIGALLYFMVTGMTWEEKAYFDTDVLVSEDFKKLIIGCISSEIGGRISSAELVIESLSKISMGKSPNISMTYSMKKWIGSKYKQKISTEKSVRIIGIASSNRGDGATSLSIAMANYLAEVRKKKVAIMECNDGAIFEYMGHHLTELSSEQDSYVIGKVAYFYDINLDDALNKYEKKFDCIIIDFGICISKMNILARRIDRKILIGSVMPYRSMFHENILNNSDYSKLLDTAIHILHGDEKNVRAYSKDKDINAVVMPYISNPYFIESKLVNFFRLLF